MKKIRLLILFLLTVTGTALSMAQVCKLVKLKCRPYEPVTMSSTLKKEVRKETNGMTAANLALYCHDKTRTLLTFTLRNHKFDDTKTTGMNCVGYAQVCATLCNYAFTVNGIKAMAKPVVGNVEMAGINLNSFAALMPGRVYNFTKDHDFVEIVCQGKSFYIDPSLDIINR